MAWGSVVLAVWLAQAGADPQPAPPDAPATETPAEATPTTPPADAPVASVAQAPSGEPIRVANVHVTPAAARTRWLRERLALEARDTRAWYVTWGVVWSLSTVGQLAMWPFTPKEDLPSLWAWSIATGVGALYNWIMRPAALGALSRLDETLAKPELSEGEKLAAAEAAYVETHDDEVWSRAWWQQIPCVALNATPFLVIGLTQKKWDVAFLVAGLVLSELQLFSFPQLLRRLGVREQVVEALR